MRKTGARWCWPSMGMVASLLALVLVAGPAEANMALPLVAVGGALATIALGALAGRWLAVRGWTAWRALPVGLVVATAWAIAVVASSTSGPAVPESQVAWTYGYGQSTTALLLSPVTWLVGLVLWEVATLVSAHRKRAQAGRNRTAV